MMPALGEAAHPFISGAVITTSALSVRMESSERKEFAPNQCVEHVLIENRCPLFRNML
jgi:hypothetical protein